MLKCKPKDVRVMRYAVDLFETSRFPSTLVQKNVPDFVLCLGSIGSSGPVGNIKGANVELGPCEFPFRSHE